jgi:large subunit ribosomal protein L10
MPIGRKEKEKIVKDLSDVAQKASALIFASFSGLKTKDMNDLRNTVKGLGGNIVITKKTLAKMAFKDIVSSEILKEPATFATIWFTGEDVPLLFRVVWNFSKTYPTLKILGGYWRELGVLDSEKVIFISKLPSREVLISQFLGVLRCPIVSLVNVLDSIKRSKS